MERVTHSVLKPTVQADEFLLCGCYRFMALKIIKEQGGSVSFDIINSLIVVRELSSWLYKHP